MKHNIALLRLMDLPLFFNKKQLASLIHLDLKQIKLLSEFSHRYYKRYFIKKTNGGLREIRQPVKNLKAIQGWILRNILDKLNPSPYATAYIQKKNITDNVLPHQSNRFFICLDLENFFPSISIRRVRKVFSLIGYSKRASNILASLCTCDGSLPQGAVTSPSLSNLITSKLDRRIAGYSSRRNIIYTRYADDITLSSNNREQLCKILPRIIKIIKSEHFKPNMQKLRVLGPRRCCTITGLVKNNSDPKFGIGRNKKRQMRAVMHHILYKQSSDIKYKNEFSILGWLNYLKCVDIQSFNQMNNYWNHLLDKTRSIT